MAGRLTGGGLRNHPDVYSEWDDPTLARSARDGEVGFPVPEIPAK